MEQNLTEMTPSDSTICDLSREVETKKRPHFTAAESDLGISSGNSICLEEKTTVQAVEETISFHESPRKKRHCCNSNDGSARIDETQSSVNDAYTQADESSFTLKEESLQTCQSEVIDTTDPELKKPNNQGSVNESCSSAGVLQNINSDLPKESLCDENVSKVNNPKDYIPALDKADTIQSTVNCHEENTSDCPSSVDQSEKRTVETVRHCRKKLLILDVNGLLADIVANPEPQYMPDAWISMKSVFKRPFCTDFLEFCFDKFEVGVWSSRNRKNVGRAIDYLMGNKQKKLLFCWDQSHCTDTGYKTMEDRNKPLFLKEITKLWDKVDPNLPWEKGDYNESNTILMDDSPHKALLNPPNTGVFPYPYEYKAIIDNLLGRKGKLRLYLERLVKADNVQKFVSENRFGQKAINKFNKSWPYYSKIYYAVCARKPENNKVINGREGQPVNDDKQKLSSEASTSEVETSVAIEDKPSTSAVTAEDVMVIPN